MVEILKAFKTFFTSRKKNAFMQHNRNILKDIYIFCERMIAWKGNAKDFRKLKSKHYLLSLIEIFKKETILYIRLHKMFCISSYN